MPARSESAPELPAGGAWRRRAEWVIYDLPVGLAATLIVVMLLAGNANTLLRSITGQQLGGSGELLVVLLPITVFLGLPAAERAGANVRSTALTDRLPPRTARVVTGAGLVVSVGTTALLFAASAAKAWDSAARGESLVGVRTLPLVPTRIAIAVGFGLLLVVLVGQVVRHVRPREPGTEAGAQAADSGSIGL